MKLLITGSREGTTEQQVKAAIETAAAKHGTPTLILHGGAKGADAHAEKWARENGTPTRIIRPDYTKHHPKAAPLKRNTELVKLADVVAAIYAPGRHGKGGTADTAKKAKAAGKPTLENTPTGHRWTEPAPTLW